MILWILLTVATQYVDLRKITNTSHMCGVQYVCATASNAKHYVLLVYSTFVYNILNAQL